MEAAVAQSAYSAIILVTGNELLKQLFQRSLGDQASLRLTLADPSSAKLRDTDLLFLDAAQGTMEQLSLLIGTLPPDVPVALVNVEPEQAEQLAEQYPAIRGVFYGNASPKQLLAGTRTLLAGGDWLPRRLMEYLLAQWRRAQQQPTNARTALTMREREILGLASKGLSNAEIATKLSLSPHTIKSHVHNLLRKIGAANRAEAAFLLRDRLDWPGSCRA
ncbi:helix-turn-helix transcriptional regulator [Azomonas macrocytogenes]|uniref:DNA-binding NarL/FixJ family response regulator n=1 Tax=Azomonas macrocytogenes TaxID=69962 RepID=A0A839T525_AZOMA|nr:response regulator transcription factor [Azomonas macrocytogenes]MBB3103414.1 DNA-binding NarL/FixJ family response regulator [Azomonas macrocytogenes]